MEGEEDKGRVRWDGRAGKRGWKGEGRSERKIIIEC
jgi:hypothetical protein